MTTHRPAPWTADQRARQTRVLAGQAVLAHLTHDTPLVQWAREHSRLTRIDRLTKWGNPFVVGQDGDRATVVDAYRRYFDRHRALHADRAELDGKVLACWCYPQLCHGSVLIEWLATHPTKRKNPDDGADHPHHDAPRHRL